MHSVWGLASCHTPRWKRMRCDAGKKTMGIRFWRTDLILLGGVLCFCTVYRVRTIGRSRPLQLVFASAWVGNCQSAAEGLASPDDTLNTAVDRLWSEGTVRHGTVRCGTGDVVLG